MSSRAVHPPRDRRTRPALSLLEGRTLLAATPTITTLSLSATAIRFSTPEVLTATVTTNPAGSVAPNEGTVTFLDGSTVIGTQPLLNGNATLTVPALTPGVHNLTASYDDSASGTFADSTSPATQPSTITTVAGGGPGTGTSFGESGDGGPATAATFNEPYGVALDSAGNIYIADGVVVREVTRATGIISTVAGNGTRGTGGLGGPATSAQLEDPRGVALDAAGNLYIADGAGNRILRVDHATGIITLFAGNGTSGQSGDGGPATAAELQYPTRMAIDSAGNVYVSSSERIRRVDHATGVISTVAGGGHGSVIGPAISAYLDPGALAIDPAGDLYFVNEQDQVLKIDHATGLLSVVAGNGDYDYGGDGGPAIDASLYDPQGLAIDAAGNLYLADYQSERVREINHATGVITTVAGNGVFGFSGDGGSPTAAELELPIYVAVDPAGDLFIADFGNERIREVIPTVSTVNVAASAASTGAGDFSGSGQADRALFDPTTATWTIQRPNNGTSYTVQFGTPGDTAVPGDYEGTGKSDLAVYDPKTAIWTIQESTGIVTIQFGDPSQGDVAIPADYDGDGKTDLAVFRPSTDEWIIHPSSGGPNEIAHYGDPAQGDVPVPGNYLGTGKATFAVFRPSIDDWIIRQADGTDTLIPFGNPAHHDVPAQGDYAGTGSTQLATYDPTDNLWTTGSLSGQILSTVAFSTIDTQNVPAISPIVTVPTTLGFAPGDLALFRPESDEWIIQQPDHTTRIDTFGSPDDISLIAVPGDYEGNGRLDLAVFRPSDDTWFIQKSDGTVESFQFGDPSKGDIPVPADYDGDGKTDFAVFRPSTDQWIIHPSGGGPNEILQFGDPAQGDVPVPGDYLGTGKATFAVFRPSVDLWIILQADGTDKLLAFGDPKAGDVPAPGEYNNDGMTDLAVYRPSAGLWIILTDPSGTTSLTLFGDPSQNDRSARP